jgi:hypothetical protein
MIEPGYPLARLGKERRGGLGRRSSGAVGGAYGRAVGLLLDARRRVWAQVRRKKKEELHGEWNRDVFGTIQARLQVGRPQSAPRRAVCMPPAHRPPAHPVD